MFAVKRAKTAYVQVIEVLHAVDIIIFHDSRFESAACVVHADDVAFLERRGALLPRELLDSS